MSELFYKDHSHILLPKEKFIFHFLLRLRGLIENDERHEQWPTPSWTKYSVAAVTANTKKTHHAWSHLQWRAVYLFGSSLLSLPYKTFLRAPSAPPLAYHSWRLSDRRTWEQRPTHHDLHPPRIIRSFPLLRAQPAKLSGYNERLWRGRW